MLSEVIDISPGNLDSSLCFFQPSVSHDVLCIEVKYERIAVVNSRVEEEGFLCLSYTLPSGVFYVSGLCL